MHRTAPFPYGLISGLIFLGTFFYATRFVGDFVVPDSVDSGNATAFADPLLVGVLLLVVCALRHGVVARPGFKKWWHNQELPGMSADGQRSGWRAEKPGGCV